MSTTQQLFIADSLEFALILRFPEEYEALRQRLVVLPDTDGQRAWLVDLHDPFDPTAQCFASMAAAQAAWSDRVYQTLYTLATEAAVKLVA
jgi:hypothetical protein